MTGLSRLRPSYKTSTQYKITLGFKRIMALAALLNLVLVAFDLSYIPFRDTYLKLLPKFTTWYGKTFKGIEPHRFTASYLQTVDQLEGQVAQTGLTSPETETLLNDLRQYSVNMINENPFQIAQKSGNLERLKDRMRDRIGTESAKDAFSTFWSEKYLVQAGYSQAIQFFNADIRPLIATNYFRDIAFDGKPIDWFWRIDIWFITLFSAEVLTRSFLRSRRYKNMTWRDALMWRWYDLLLIIPFSALRLPLLGLLRFIPVTQRLSNARIIDLRPFQGRVIRFLISQIVVELTELILLRLIDQIQNLIRNGEVSRWLLYPETRREYIDLNDIDELEVITQRTLRLLLDQVLPQIKPELDAVVNQSIQKTLLMSPAYQTIRGVPGLGSIPTQITERMVAQVSISLYNGLKLSLANFRDNPELEVLIQKLTSTLRIESERDNAVQEIEAMIIALLDEIKVNYVKRLSEEDYDLLLEQRFLIYDVTQEKVNSSR